MPRTPKPSRERKIIRNLMQITGKRIGQPHYVDLVKVSDQNKTGIGCFQVDASSAKLILHFQPDYLFKVVDWISKVRTYHAGVAGRWEMGFTEKA
jgi:uncharacterized protein YfaT (DUF1175 family)